MDIVSCCLFLHHLEPLQVARYLAEARRVARVAVLSALAANWLYLVLAGR